MASWHNIRFLESSGNLKPLIRARTGRTPSTTLVREIGACLQQGRLFYERASETPLELKPLLLYYGLVAFAKAMVVGTKLRQLSTLRHAHGLTDVSAQGCRLLDLRVKIDSAGTFQEFNDVVAPLSKFCYWGADSRPTSVVLPSASAKDLENRCWGLKDILSRIPGLQDLYRATFNEEPNTAALGVDFQARNDDYCEIRIDDRRIFSSRQELRGFVEDWRDRYPFLKDWHFVSGRHAYGRSFLNFANIENKGVDEFSEDQLEPANGGFQNVTEFWRDQSFPRIPIRSILVSMGGGFSPASPHAIVPLDGLYPSEFALHFLSLFLLSSVVRYRPDTWAHAISRSILADKPPDDELIALLEDFLHLNATDIPELVVKALNPHQDEHA